MKKITNCVAAIAATFLVYSCSNEIEENVAIDQSEFKTIEAIISDVENGDIETRTNINSNFKFSFAEGDTLGIFPKSGDQIYFAIEGDAGGNTATFSGGGWGLKSGQTYYTYYPFSRKNSSSESSKNNVEFSMAKQSIDGDNLFGHLGKYAPMYAKNENTSGAISVHLKHLASFLLLNVTLDSDCEIYEIILSTDQKDLFYHDGKVDLTKETPSISKCYNYGAYNSTDIRIPCNNLKLKANTNTSIPVAILPTDLTGKKMRVTFCSSSKADYTFELSINKKWEQGKYYVQNLTSNVKESTHEIPTANGGEGGYLYADLQYTDFMHLTELKVTGNLDSEDILFLRNMAGVDYYGKRTNGALIYLDMSEANMITDSYDHYYSPSPNWEFSTGKDVISERMFESSNLENVILPNNIWSIYDRAFENCKQLKKINIPNKVTQITYGAFQNCTALESIEFPSGIKTIDKNAFAGCTNLKLVVIPSTITNLSGGEFINCTGLKSVTINAAITTLGWTFAGCSGLETFTIPNSVTTIGESALEGCTGLIHITLPNSVTTIERWAFSGCTGLTGITMPNSVMAFSRGYDSFEGCVNLKNLYLTNLSNWCKSTIGIHPFATSQGGDIYLDGNKITNLVLPNDITITGKNTFMYCTGIKTVDIPSNITTISSRSFYGSGISQIEIPSNVTTIESSAFSFCKELVSISLPPNITKIPDQILYGCSKLTSISIPASVTEIGLSAFEGCENLSEVRCNRQTPPTLIGYSSWGVPVGIEQFSGISKNAKLYVPKGCKSAYSSWGEYFSEIIEMNN